MRKLHINFKINSKAYSITVEVSASATFDEYFMKYSTEKAIEDYKKENNLVGFASNVDAYLA